MNITNVNYDKIIKFSCELQYFTEISEVNPIPNSTIIYKTVTGLGATHAEVAALRSSIIVLPHIAIVKSKHENYKTAFDGKYKTMAIYGKVSWREVADYLMSDVEHAKILTTPHGLRKLIVAIEHLNAHQAFECHLDYKTFFFILLDECQKVIQDAEYRKDLIEVMDHFFEFENKAMVSATPIPPSDPRFKNNEFQHIKLEPAFEYRHPIELIQANSIVNALKKYIEDNESTYHCIFFNSIRGIKAIVEQLNLKDYKIYCSEESTELLVLNNEPNATYVLDKDFKPYMFYTSSFYSGLDIELPQNPNIVIITDHGFQEHTLLDPFTEIPQIIGRFRKKFKDHVPYNKITHINNSSHFTTPITEAEAQCRVQYSKLIYDYLKVLKTSTMDKSFQDYIDQQLSTIKPHSKLLIGERLSEYLLDNYINNERVKGYYATKTTLLNGYISTKRFWVYSKVEYSSVDEIDKMQNKGIRYSTDLNKIMVEALVQLEPFRGLDIYDVQVSVISKLSYIIYEAYNRLGVETLQSLNYRIGSIKKALLKLDVEEGKNKIPIINQVHLTFRLNKYYTCDFVKDRIQKIYNEYNIQCVAKASDAERYFEHVLKWKREANTNKRVYIFTSKRQYTVPRIMHV